MAFLSGIFGGGDSDSSSTDSNSSDLISDITSSLSLDAQSTQYDRSVDDDGSSDESFSDNSLSTDLDTSSLLASITDNFSQQDQSSDSDNGGGLFG